MRRVIIVQKRVVRFLGLQVALEQKEIKYRMVNTGGEKIKSMPPAL